MREILLVAPRKIQWLGKRPLIALLLEKSQQAPKLPRASTLRSNISASTETLKLKQKHVVEENKLYISS